LTLFKDIGNNIRRFFFGFSEEEKKIIADSQAQIAELKTQGNYKEITTNDVITIVSAGMTQEQAKKYLDKKDTPTDNSGIYLAGVLLLLLLLIRR
jgi:peptide methionine sulfoxide reductase MsrA